MKASPPHDLAGNGRTATLTPHHGQDNVQPMEAISYTAARENLAATMQKVCDDRAPIIITRNRDQAVVMMALEEYEALEETAHLLSSPANARRLLESIQELKAGKGKPRQLAAE